MRFLRFLMNLVYPSSYCLTYEATLINGDKGTARRIVTIDELQNDPEGVERALRNQVMEHTGLHVVEIGNFNFQALT